MAFAKPALFHHEELRIADRRSLDAGKLRDPRRAASDYRF
jgi:hypothetical protein